MAYTFKNIRVWQRAHELVLEIYKITNLFPANEKYGLTIQLRRSASSIPTNIVEGYKRKTDKEFSYFLSVADGSLEETKYQLFLALELKYIRKEDYERLSKIADEIGGMLFCFQKKLRA